MKKRTKVSIGIIIGAAVCLGMCALLLIGITGVGGTIIPAVSMGMRNSAWFAAVIFGMLGVGMTTFATSSSITGAIRRANARKTEVKTFQQIAEMQRSAESSKVTIKTNENIQKLANQFTKSGVYLANNERLGLLGPIDTPGKTKKQLYLQNKLEKVKERREYGNASPSNAGIRISKKYDGIATKLEKQSADAQKEQGPIEGSKYDWQSQIINPQSNTIIKDYRNSINCFSSETLNHFKNDIQSDMFSSDSKIFAKENRYEIGYCFSLKFGNGNNVEYKPTKVRSNVDENMEKYELMLLLEFQKELNTNPELEKSLFPVLCTKKHYKSEEKFDIRTATIYDRKALDNRIEILKHYVAKDNKIVATNKNYLLRTYSVKSDQLSSDDSVKDKNILDNTL